MLREERATAMGALFDWTQLRFLPCVGAFERDILERGNGNNSFTEEV